MEKSKLESLVTKYLNEQQGRLSETTIHNRAYTLRHVYHAQDPETLYKYLKEEKQLKPYSIKTTLVQISHFWQWLIDEQHIKPEPNRFKKWMKSHSNNLKYAYEKERLDVTFEEALERIDKIGRREIRQKARQLILSGMRYTESFSLSKGTVRRKGGKRTPVFMPKELQSINFSLSYSTFRRELKKVGLKPHTLRKLFANEAVRRGVTNSDLLRLMGWESIKTAESYLQAKRDDELQDFVETFNSDNEEAS